MGIRYLKSVTPGSRFASRPDFADITDSRPEKSLTGKIIIDFKRNKYDIPG